MRLLRLRFSMGIVLSWFIPLCLWAQDDLNVHGVVSDAFSSSKINGVEVVVNKDGSRHNAFTTRANGKYEFYLDVGSRYELVFSKEGYVTRSIVIDSRNVPPEVLGAGIIMPTDMSMYAITEAMADADLSVFDKPIGKALYDPAQADLVWDFAYTSTVRNEINSFMRDIERKQKEMDKQAEADAKEADKRQEQFDDFVKKGDAAMSKSNFEDAVLNYKAALNIFSDNAAVSAKLANAEAEWDAVKAAQQLEDDYNAALNDGDGFMRTGDLEKAVTSYETALGLKPGEKYPADQIAEANRLIAEKAANRAKQEEFNDLMAQADVLAGEEDYEAAIAKYNEALKVIPGNQEAESKRDNAQKAWDALRQAEQMRAEYDAAIAEADALFSQEQYEAAMEKYRDASVLIPAETYPVSRIELCQTKLDELANAQKVQADFDALMASGDEALGAARYEDAVADFEGALALIPNDADAISRRDQARGLLAEVRAEKELRENYNAAIETADIAFGDERFEEAKSAYQEAKNLIPEEEYPTSKISEINRILSERAAEAAVQNAYDEALQAASAAMEAERYSDAVTHYDAALSAFPGDEVATAGREEARSKHAARMAAMESREAYDAMIASADGKLGNDMLEAAIVDYEAALEILPDEAYPKDQIAVIRAKIAEREAQEALQAEFDEWVGKGDAFSAQTAYEDAIDAYSKALDLQESAVVSDKLDKARKDLAELESLKDTEERYTAAIQSADKNFEEEAWTRAKEDYLKALGIKPGEAHPTQRVELIDEKLEGLAAAEADRLEREKTEQVNALVLQGDEASRNKNYDAAIEKYTEALTILPDRADISEKRAQAERDLLATMEKEALDEAYAEELAKADAHFDESRWEEAIEGYGEALGIKPGEKYPQDRMAQAEMELQKLAEEADMEAQMDLRRDFDKRIASGDRDMGRGKFDNAVEEYTAALNLIPESATAQEKLAAAKDALATQRDDEADLLMYEAKIEEADALFDEESFEMAKLAYLDASELMPNRRYPTDRVTAIELLLEKRRMEEDRLGQQALREAYDEAVSKGDGYMASQSYENARTAYNEAIEILPEEVYPKSQIDRIDLLLKEAKERADNRDRTADAGNQPNPDRHRERERVEYNRVNADSEDQAEQFMREAREAQRSERHERIKKLKEARKDDARRYSEASKEAGADNARAVESLRAETELQKAVAKANQEEKIENSRKYKEAILNTATRRSEMERVELADNFEAVQNMEENRKNQSSEQLAARAEQAREVRTANVNRLEQITTWHRESYDNRKSVDDRIRDEAERRRQSERNATERRVVEANEIQRRSRDHHAFLTELSRNNLVEIKQYEAEIREENQRRDTRRVNLNMDKVEAGAQQAKENRERHRNAMEENRALADQRREKNLEELRNVKVGHPKSPDEFHRSTLARDYPQGVTEESSTLGNKVIITRVVVKGNRGDEYKKVVDQAGNYYFKNGQSISRYTWDQETLFAFDKSKD